MTDPSVIAPITKAIVGDLASEGGEEKISIPYYDDLEV